MDLKKSPTKKVVLAGGVFDIIHPGHIHTLNAAKALADVLVVAIATTKTSPKAFAALSVCICPGWIMSKTPPANTIFFDDNFFQSNDNHSLFIHFLTHR